MKLVIKFKFDDKEGYLSVVEKGNHYYALVQKETPKVKNIEHSHKLHISYELKQPNYIEVEANVLYDQELIASVYHQLEEEKNLYFKSLDDTLCVLELPKSV
jgi:general stress protein 26